jgi:hypothetical protein
VICETRLSATGAHAVGCVIVPPAWPVSELPRAIDFSGSVFSGSSDPLLEIEAAGGACFAVSGYKSREKNPSRLGCPVSRR